MTDKSASILAEAATREIDAAADEAVTECITQMEIDTGEVPEIVKLIVRNAGRGFFYSGARFAMLHYDCYPKT